jgi:RecJ-like exonuclease
MKKTTAVLAALALTFAGTLPAFSADGKTAEVAPAAAPEKVYLPTELDALRPLVGKPVTIEGKLQRLGANKGQTIRYLNFTANYRDSVALVFFVEKGGDAFTKEKLTEWLGKKVRATGRVAEFNGNLQMEIEKLDQLQEIPETAPAAEPAKTP